MILEPGGDALEPGEAADAAQRLLELARRRIESEQADEIAALQRDPAEQQTGIDGMVEPRHAVERLAHEVAGVEGQHHMMVALGAELLAQELAVARRMLPVDEAAVEPGRIFAQRIVFGALPLLLLHLDAEEGLAGKELQRLAVHAA